MSSYNNIPVCPHCDNKEHAWWDGMGFDGDGAGIIIECGNCEKQYHARMHVDTNFTSSKTKECSKCKGTKKGMIDYLGKQIEAWCSWCDAIGLEAES